VCYQYDATLNLGTDSRQLYRDYKIWALLPKKGKLEKGDNKRRIVT